MNKIHFSIDDTITMFEELSRNEYKSIFDNKMLGFLKSMHDKYNIKVTFYCFIENYNHTFKVNKLKDNYVKEFINNNNWIKFGFHGISGDTYIDKLPLEEFENNYEYLNSFIKSISNTKLSNIIRIHCYNSNNNINKYLKKYGKIILLCSEKINDKMYGLNFIDKIRLYYFGNINKNKIAYKKNTFRIENYNINKIYNYKDKKRNNLFYS